MKADTNTVYEKHLYVSRVNVTNILNIIHSYYFWSFGTIIQHF